MGRRSRTLKRLMGSSLFLARDSSPFSPFNLCSGRKSHAVAGPVIYKFIYKFLFSATG
jgi:hypothetical protein